MSLLGDNQAAIRWSLSYLSDLSQRCIVNGKLSTACDFRCGVLQLLRTLLFLIYINDLPNCLRAAALRMFADETNITLPAETLTDLKQPLSPELSNFSCWLKCSQSRVNDNIEKIAKNILSYRCRKNLQNLQTFNFVTF